MIIIIDAYNFIKHISKNSFVAEREKQYWMETFKEYAQKRGNEVLLVFDAGPGLYQVIEPHGALTVIYSGQMQTADDAIKKWLKQHQGQDILLVTSDREIRDFAHKVNVISIGSDEFYDIFQQVIVHQNQYEQKVVQTLHKTTESDLSELDELMEQGSRYLVQDQVEQAEVVLPRMKNSKKESKSHRRLLRKIEKI